MKYLFRFLSVACGFILGVASVALAYNIGRTGWGQFVFVFSIAAVFCLEVCKILMEREDER